VQSPVRSEIPREFLDHIDHLANININEANVSDLLLLSEEFRVPDLSARCAVFPQSGSGEVARVRDLENLRSEHCRLKNQVLKIGSEVVKLRTALEAEQSYRRGQEILHGEHGYRICVSLGLKLLKSAADKGNCDANHVYGHHLNEGKLCEQNVAESLKYLRRSAELANSVGEFRSGSVEDSSQIIRSLKQSTDQGNALAQLELAKRARKRWDFDEFGKYSKMAADEGEPLGFLYWSLSLAEGWGTRKNSSAATTYLSKAVKLCGSYGKVIYAKELEVLGGFAEDPRWKARFFKMGSDAGSSICSRRYADLLSSGEGIVIDPIEASQYFKLAADRGDSSDKEFYARFRIHRI
jgi:TPR repeat protein